MTQCEKWSKYFCKDELFHMNSGLTGGWLVAVVSVSEVLRILHHRYTSHPYDNRIRTSIQSAWSNNPMVDVMKRAGGVFLTADHSYGTWNNKKGQ